MLLAFMHLYLWQNQLVHAKLGSWLTMDKVVMVHDEHQPLVPCLPGYGSQHALSVHLEVLQS